MIPIFSARDPWHFGANPDPDPWIRTDDFKDFKIYIKKKISYNLNPQAHRLKS
jgi:hypothetical protein